MKKITLLSVFTLLVVTANAQVTSLHQNFDVACVTSTSFPYSIGWAHFNPIVGTDPDGAWACSPTDGKGATPGIECTNFYTGGPHLDTSFFISPLLNFTAYDNVYLTFDSKASNISAGGRLSVLESNDSTFHTYITIDSLITPLFGIPDSSNWVTHEANLTGFKASYFYIAFRYTGAATAGTIWYLDNINTTDAPLNVSKQDRAILPIRVLGNSTPNKITLAFSGDASSTYCLSIYDIIGREVHKEIINGQNIKAEYTINNLNLLSGMYIIKMGDGNSYGFTKVIVQ